jgi:hypothetical protein
MMARSCCAPVNPAQVLLLIREKQATSHAALLRHLAPSKPSPSALNMLRWKILQTVENLRGAGLVAVTGEGGLVATDLVAGLQLALEFSLTELSNTSPTSMTVQPIFGRPNSDVPPADIFVLMPFADQLRPVFEDHMKPTAQRLDMSIARADDFFSTEAIVQDIWAAINQARFIVADCTGRNPNVFYELGLAHAVGKRTVLITQAMDDVPFDLRHRRCIEYKYTPRGMIKFDEEFASALRAGVGPPPIPGELKNE